MFLDQKAFSALRTLEQVPLNWYDFWCEITLWLIRLNCPFDLVFLWKTFQSQSRPLAKWRPFVSLRPQSEHTSLNCNRSLVLPILLFVKSLLSDPNRDWRQLIRTFYREKDACSKMTVQSDKVKPFNKSVSNWSAFSRSIFLFVFTRSDLAWKNIPKNQFFRWVVKPRRWSLLFIPQTPRTKFKESMFTTLCLSHSLNLMPEASQLDEFFFERERENKRDFLTIIAFSHFLQLADNGDPLRPN